MLHRYRQFLNIFEGTNPKINAIKNSDDKMYKDISTNPNSDYLKNKSLDQLNSMSDMAKSDERYSFDALDKKFPPNKVNNLYRYNIPEKPENKPYAEVFKVGARNAIGNINLAKQKLYAQNNGGEEKVEQDHKYNEKFNRYMNLATKFGISGALAGVITNKVMNSSKLNERIRLLKKMEEIKKIDCKSILNDKKRESCYLDKKMTLEALKDKLNKL